MKKKIIIIEIIEILKKWKIYLKIYSKIYVYINKSNNTVLPLSLTVVETFNPYVNPALWEKGTHENIR